MTALSPWRGQRWLNRVNRRPVVVFSPSSQAQHAQRVLLPLISERPMACRLCRVSKVSPPLIGSFGSVWRSACF